MTNAISIRNERRTLVIITFAAALSSRCIDTEKKKKKKKKKDTPISYCCDRDRAKFRPHVGTFFSERNDNFERNLVTMESPIDYPFAHQVTNWTENRIIRIQAQASRDIFSMLLSAHSKGGFSFPALSFFFFLSLSLSVKRDVLLWRTYLVFKAAAPRSAWFSSVR